MRCQQTNKTSSEEAIGRAKGGTGNGREIGYRAKVLGLRVGEGFEERKSQRPRRRRRG